MTIWIQSDLLAEVGAACLTLHLFANAAGEGDFRSFADMQNLIKRMGVNRRTYVKLSARLVDAGVWRKVDNGYRVAEKGIMRLAS